MDNWLSAAPETLLITAGSSLLIVIAVMALVRLFGLRSLAKMSSVGFASTVAIGSLLAATALSPQQSVLEGAVAIFVILGVQQAFSMGKRRFPRLGAIGENEPVYLMIGPDILEENMARTGVSRADLMAKLREANVIRLSQVKAVVFETTGDISVLHGSEDIRVDEEIMVGVKR